MVCRYLTKCSTPGPWSLLTHILICSVLSEQRLKKALWNGLLGILRDIRIMMQLRPLTSGLRRISKWITLQKCFGCSTHTWPQSINPSHRTKDFKYGWATTSFLLALRPPSLIIYMAKWLFHGIPLITASQLVTCGVLTRKSVRRLSSDSWRADKDGVRNIGQVLQCRCQDGEVGWTTHTWLPTMWTARECSIYLVLPGSGGLLHLGPSYVLA